MLISRTEEHLPISLPRLLQICLGAAIATVISQGLSANIIGLGSAAFIMQFTNAMVDLDNFKKINDTYGHEFGDAVLKNLSDILMSSMGESDIAVRWGGEEFILSMRVLRCHKSSIPVAGSNVKRSVRCFSFLCYDLEKE